MDEHSNNFVLTEHMVLTKTRASSLSDVKTLNMWGFNLKDISLFERMPNVEICSLPVNQICNLSPLSNCHKMRELYLRQNNISDFNELNYLSGLRFLKNLSLSGNPIANSPNYKQTVLQILPQLEKLDDVEVGQSYQPPPKSIPNDHRRSKSSVDGQNFSSTSGPFSQTHKVHQSYENNNQDFHHQIPDQHIRSYQTLRPPRYGYSNMPPNNQKSGNYSNTSGVGGRSDKGALTAVLALLPELTPESLDIVQQTIDELQSGK